MDGQRYVDVLEDVVVVDVEVAGLHLLLAEVAREHAVGRVAPVRFALLALVVERRLDVRGR